MTSPISLTSLQGMQKAEGQLDKGANRIAKQGSEGGDVVDLSAEMVALMSARNNFAANVKAAKTGDEMQQSLLNILA